MPHELNGLRAQHPVFGGRYRIDFALPKQKIGIELDGYAWHSSPEAFTRDRARQRELELDGWRIVRFSGSEIIKDADDCVRQAAAFAASIERDRPTS
ncbi:endonuclease domain-containing protein [Streptomyces albogriseolus]